MEQLPSHSSQRRIDIPTKGEQAELIAALEAELAKLFPGKRHGLNTAAKGESYLLGLSMMLRMEFELNPGSNPGLK